MGRPGDPTPLPLRGANIGFADVPPHCDGEGEPGRHSGEGERGQAERRGGLIVPVPEAEAVVRGWRARFAPDAALGVPAHVTLLFPFHTLDQLDQTDRADLTELFSSTPSIRVTFGAVGRFPEVVYLAPEPREWFVRLTEALSGRFGLPPYGGIHDEIVPHLTVAQHGDPAVLAEIAASLTDHLPIEADIHEAWLMEEAADGRWDRTATFALRE